MGGVCATELVWQLLCFVSGIYLVMTFLYRSSGFLFWWCCGFESVGAASLWRLG